MKKYRIALYIRLSLEDAKTDSMSISSQRSILREYASELTEYANAELMEFVDNGYSGANFERPAVQELLDLVRANRIDCIMVKDFSRFGRNSLETGYFIERVFPLFHTRFISVNDDFDTQKLRGDTGGMEVAFKYLISEYYSRDMSVKTKTAKYLKFQRGEYQSKICPYGYRKGENGRMVPDPETSEVVQKIFEYAVNGMNAADIARELSRYQLNILVLEKEEDVCCGTSKANSAIIHAGHDAKPGSLKARFNVRGNELMDQLSADLNFPFTRNGSLVLCFEESQIPELEELADRGRKNGVPGLSIVTGEDIKSLEPALSDDVKAVLVCPTGGIVCPFLMTIALAENAAVNGVSFRFDSRKEKNHRCRLRRSQRCKAAPRRSSALRSHRRKHQADQPLQRT